MNRRGFFGFLAVPFFAPLARLLDWTHLWPKAPLPSPPRTEAQKILLETFREIYGKRLNDEANRSVWLLNQMDKQLLTVYPCHWTVPEQVDPEILS